MTYIPSTFNDRININILVAQIYEIFFGWGGVKNASKRQWLPVYTRRVMF